MNQARIAAVALGLELTLGAPAFADDPLAAGGKFAPCSDDVHRFCARAIGQDEKHIAHCMRFHYFRLSKACKTAIKAARAEHEADTGDDVAGRP